MQFKWTILPSVALMFNVFYQCSTRKHLNLGLITPLDGKLGFERVAAASTMAIEDAKNHGYLKDVDVRIIWRNGNCDGKEALGGVANLWATADIDGFFGLPCSVAAINAGKLIAYWDLPHLSYSSVDPVLADKVTYNTLVRLMSPYNRMADAMVELFQYYHWSRVVLVMMSDPDNYCDYAGRAFYSRFQKANITVAEWYREQNEADFQLDNWLTQIKQQGRIIVLCAVDQELRQFMLHAHYLNMTTDYVFIAPSLLPADNLETPWMETDSDNNMAARAAYNALLQMSLGIIKDPESISFMDEIPYRMAEPPWNYNNTLESGQKGSPFALFLYDSVYLFAMVADEAYRLNSTPRNGSLVYQLAQKETFTGKSGVVMLDSNGDRIGNYMVWHLPQTATAYEELLEIIMTDTTTQRVRAKQQRDWGSSGLEPPPDQPPCGFFNEHCLSGKPAINITVIMASVIAVAVVIGCLVIGAHTYRRKRFEQELTLMLWKVRFNELQLLKSKNLKMTASQIGSQSSCCTVSSVARVEPGASKILMATYKGLTVAVHMVNKTGILLTRADQLELKTMREINQENLNGFVGACVDPPNICVIYRFCSKGSLDDLLLNDDIKLDYNFKLSFLTDLIQGMEYLHRTDIGSHGRLKSTNCVIDGRWILKVTDWGLPSFRENHYENDYALYTAMMWTAPELLRNSDPPACGTQKGDVYSFAIIIQEILYRTSPYQAEGSFDMVPKDLIGRIRNGETPPFRPVLPKDPSQDTTLVSLMKDCWDEDHDKRPDFQAIKNRLSKLNKGKRYNIMDNMLRMMEKYANNLEQLVEDRTQQLVDEKKKTDMLLYRMLPSQVADCLKTGKTFTPELYKEVTVYFSDIVAFTTMASDSSPLEIVDFLNDLWTLFDGILCKYDVYKVETIGDAYMVASGLPIPNPCHTAEVANMALDILSSVMTFKIRHHPQEQLKIRIGMHSGSCVAGVVGLTMPRYCLFGDTVNMASRMESNGEALRIHLSEQVQIALMKLSMGFYIAKRGRIEIKGKGLQTTYWLEGKEGYTRPLPRFTD